MRLLRGGWHVIVLLWEQWPDGTDSYFIAQRWAHLEIGYCIDCNELNYAMTNKNGTFERASMSNNHFGHKQYIFDAPNKYVPPIRNVLTKLQASAPISHNEIVLFKMAISFGELDAEFEKVK